MARNNGFYHVYDYGDKLDPGKTLKIEHAVSFQDDKADISKLTALSISELQSQRESSIAAEKMIFENLREAVKAWESQAAKTMMLDKAIEYVRIPATEHTANQWQDGNNGEKILSNAVYKMYYRVSDESKYDRALQKHVPAGWNLTWDVWTNAPARNGFAGGHKIAGQYNKHFTDKAAMEKYLQGRIKAYSHLFTEISPPIPQELAKHFSVNGRLLPGYRVEGQERERPSALDKLAAAKEAAAQNGAEKASPGMAKKKTHGGEEI